MSQVDTKQVVRMFTQHLQSQTKKFDDRQFWAGLRSTFRAKTALLVSHTADYKAHVERLAADARCTAFEELVNQLGKTMHTADINMILPVLRRAGFKYKGGDVSVNGVFMEVFPAIAFEPNLGQKPKDSAAANADRIAKPAAEVREEAKAA